MPPNVLFIRVSRACVGADGRPNVSQTFHIQKIAIPADETAVASNETAVAGDEIAVAVEKS